MRHRFLRVLALSRALALSLSISLALTRARSLLLSFLPGGGSDTHRLHTSSSPCHTDRVATPPLREGCHTERVATPAHTGFHVDSVATLTELPRTAHCADEGQETACAQTYIPWSRDKRGPFARAAVWSGRGVSAGLGADVLGEVVTRTA